MIEVFGDIFGNILFGTKSADVGKSEFGGFIDGFEEGEFVKRVSFHADAPAELFLSEHGGCEFRAGGGGDGEIAEDELGGIEVELEHFRVLVNFRIVTDSGEEDPAAAVVLHPGEGIVVVGAEAGIAGLVAGKVGFCGVDAQDNTDTMA